MKDRKLTVNFALTGVNLDPDTVTQLLSVKPTRHFKNGDVVKATKFSRERTWFYSAWSYDSENHCSSDKLIDHLMYIMDMFYKFKDSYFGYLAELEKLDSNWNLNDSLAGVLVRLMRFTDLPEIILGLDSAVIKRLVEMSNGIYCSLLVVNSVKNVYEYGQVSLCIYGKEIDPDQVSEHLGIMGNENFYLGENLERVENDNSCTTNRIWRFTFPEKMSNINIYQQQSLDIVLDIFEKRLPALNQYLEDENCEVGLHIWFHLDGVGTNFTREHLRKASKICNKMYIVINEDDDSCQYWKRIEEIKPFLRGQ